MNLGTIDVETLGYILHEIEAKETMTVEELHDLVIRIADERKAKGYFSVTSPTDLVDHINEYQGNKSGIWVTAIK